MKSIGIIGYGSLGASLAHALCEKGLLSWLLIRNEHAKKKAENVHVPIFSSLDEIPVKDCSIILAIPDSEIQGVAKIIHEMYEGKGCHALVHCSGSLGIDILSGNDSSIACIGIHPFQTIVSHADLPDTPWGIECREEDIEDAKALINSFRGVPHVLSPKAIENKALYHATAVASANLLQMLIALTSTMADAADIPAALFLPKIQSTTLDRAHASLHEHISVLHHLTGPLIRCDIQTIRANREAIRQIPGMDEVYTALCKAIIPQLLESKQISEKDVTTLQHVLNLDEPAR